MSMLGPEVLGQATQEETNRHFNYPEIRKDPLLFSRGPYKANYQTGYKWYQADEKEELSHVTKKRSEKTAKK